MTEWPCERDNRQSELALTADGGGGEDVPIEEVLLLLLRLLAHTHVKHATTKGRLAQRPDHSIL